MAIFIFELVVDALFALDIILNFFTAYIDQESSLLITHPRLIARRYLKGFFLIDLIATIPFGYILTESPIAISTKIGKIGRLPRLIKFARAARLLKLLRVYKLQELIMRLEIHYNVHHGISRMIKIVSLIMLVTHLVACFWFLIGLASGDGGGESKRLINSGWVYRYQLDASPKAHQVEYYNPSLLNLNYSIIPYFFDSCLICVTVYKLHVLGILNLDNSWLW